MSLAPIRGAVAPHTLTHPSQEIRGAVQAAHTPVRGDRPPVFLPPGVGVQGAVIWAEEPHQLPQGHLYQGEL